MRVIVTAENRFARTPDGATWTPVQYARRFWDRYLRIFDEVRVVGRVRDVSEVPTSWLRVDGDGVVVRGLPYYEGSSQFLLRSRAFRREVHAALDTPDPVIFRVGSPISRVALPTLQRTGRPFAVEVIADPWDAFAPGSVDHPLRPFFRWWFTRALKLTCLQAASATYVTQFAMQRRYPANPTAFATYYSDVELNESAYAPVPKVRTKKDGPIKLISVGSLAQMYKAPDVVLDAMAVCVKNGLDLRLTWVGDGQHRQALTEQAAALGLAERVRFLGALPPGDAVRAELDQADLFLLVSRHEGLPRALVEAMARGLPCIGSTVGGISELLSTDDLVEPGSIPSLVSMLETLANDPDRMSQMAARGLEKTREFSASVLRARQDEFLRTIRDQTDAWRAMRSWN